MRKQSETQDPIPQILMFLLENKVWYGHTMEQYSAI